MPTNAIDMSKRKKVLFHNTQFLREEEFRTEQNFYLYVRRYLNYLLFDEGILHTQDPIPVTVPPTDPPLRVKATGMLLEVTPGIALIRDDATQEGFEIEVSADPAADALRQFDFRSAGLSDTDTITVVLYRDELSFSLAAPENDRTVERALIGAFTPSESLPSQPYLTLATVAASGGTGPSAGDATTLTPTNLALRGGVKLAILSGEVRSMLGGPTVPATLTGIAIGGPGTITVGVGGTQALTVTAQLSDGSSRGLAGGDGTLVWANSDATETFVSVSTIGVLSGVSATTSSVTITATLTTSGGDLVDTIGVNVTSIPIPTISSLSVTSGFVGAPVTINGTNFTGATNVTFNGTAASFVVDSYIQISTSVPASATSGPVVVTTPGGPSPSPPTFTVLSPVSITSFSPGAVSINATNLEIRGSGLHRPGFSNGDTALGTTVRFLDATSGVAIASTTPAAAGDTEILVDDLTGTERIRVTVPDASEFSVTVPSGSSLAVNLEVDVDGSSDAFLTDTLDIFF